MLRGRNSLRHHHQLPPHRPSRIRLIVQVHIKPARVGEDAASQPGVDLGTGVGALAQLRGDQRGDYASRDARDAFVIWAAVMRSVPRASIW